MLKKKFCLIALIIFIIFSILGVFNSANTYVFAKKDRLKLATTTSVEDTGLMYELNRAFKKSTGIDVDVIAVGTGKALKLGENGDVDAVLVHAREAEEKFVKDGFGLNRKDVMYNDFVIIGPKDDPAKLKDAINVADAFKKLSESNIIFISRGDDSGTHKKEKALWLDINYEPMGSWYKEAGLGMGKTILMADNFNAYTLTDKASFLNLEDKIKLVICYQNDPKLKNYYGIIAVNPERYKNINFDGAKLFIDFITSDEGQTIINNFKIKGQQLFYPDAKQQEK
ncbi:MAG: substrate-binding domain-containing protein [Cyanobacteriota bacterium]